MNTVKEVPRHFLLREKFCFFMVIECQLRDSLVLMVSFFLLRNDCLLMACFTCFPADIRLWDLANR